MVFRQLVAKEILNNLLNLRFSLAYFLCTFLLIGGAVIALSDYLSAKKVYDIDTSFHAGREIDGLAQASEFVYRNKTVLRRPLVTTIFFFGGERDADGRATVSKYQSPYFAGTMSKNPLGTLFPAVDMVFVVGVVLSLLIFVLTYDSLSGEREEGTLKVLLSGPVPRDLIYFAKWIGGCCTVAIPLVTAWLVVMLILVVSPSAEVAGDDWLRMALLLGVGLLYVAVIFSLAMMVSALVKSSNVSILVLLLLWALGIVVIPALSPVAAVLWGKSTSQGEIDLTTSRTIIHSVDELESAVKSQAEERERLVKQINATGGADPSLSVRADSINTWINKKVDELIMGRVLETWRMGERMNVKTDNRARWFARVSPYGCFQSASAEIAGTGMRNEQDLRASLENYYLKCVEYSKGKDKKEFDRQTAPVFHYRRTSAMDAAGHSLLDIVILVVMGSFFFLFGYSRFLRMEVT